MTSINLDVINMIGEINRIYSNSYKKFFSIQADKYINVEDLLTDLTYLVPKWDSHANIIARNTFQDNTDSIINSFGNGYIYVSRNAKIDNINSICRGMIDRGTKTITINTLALNDTPKYDDILCGIILPFINESQRIVSTTASHKLYFEFDADKRKYSSYQVEKHKHRDGIIHKSFKGININLVLHQNLASKWYQRLHNSSNVTIYSYEEIGDYYSMSYVNLRSYPAAPYYNSMIGFKYSVLVSDYPKKLKNKLLPLPKQLRPMT